MAKQDAHLVLGETRYEDIFRDPHLTRYCREITIEIDPRIGNGMLQQVSAMCSDSPDCADEECEKSKAALPPPDKAAAIVVQERQ